MHLEWLAELRLRLRSLMHRHRLDRDFEDELRFHIESSAARYRDEGLTAREAGRRARLRFGNPAAIREALRDMWTFRWVEELRQDLDYSVRMLRRNATFTTASVLTLGLGIGAATAIFSVVNAVLLRPLPYDDPDGIHRIRTMDARGLPLGQVGQAHIAPLNETNGAVQVAAYGFVQESSILGRDGVALPIAGYLASERFFEVFKDPLVLGGFEASDGIATVISHRIWRDVFQSDPHILGSVVIMNGSQRLVTGVAAPGFEFPSGTEAWTSIRIRPGPVSDVVTNMDGYVRLKPGSSRDQLQAELDVLARRLGPWPDGHPLQFVPVPLLEDIVGAFGSTVLLLSGAAVMLLLIACLNVANLLLTRGAVRAREIALRAALGAGWWRVLRQLMTETFVLCVAGGALGFTVAAVAVRTAGAIRFAGLPRLDGVTIDRNVLLFSAACTLTTILAVGLAPALRKARGLSGLINEGGRAATGGPHRTRLFGVFVVAEVALAVTLVIGAGLLVRSYTRLSSVALGFEPERLVSMQINVTGRVGGAGTEYLPVARFYQDLMDRIRAVRGVTSVAATSHVPLQSGIERVSGAPVLLPGETFDPRKVRQTQTLQVSPNYFEAMGIRPVAGRLLRPTDQRDGPGVVLVNEAFVRFVYGGRDAVGQTLGFPGAALWAPGAMAFPLGVMATDQYQIVGVIPDIRQTTVWDEPQPTVYFPHEQWTVRRMAIVVRADVDEPRALIPAIRAVLAEMDPTLPPSFAVYGDLLSAATARQRLGTTLLVAFGLVSLGLAAVGIYGLMSYLVSLRTGEIAIRSALGARSSEMLRMIVAHAVRLSVIGIALGLVSAWAMRTFVAGQLYEISALDPLVFAIVPTTILAVSILSSYVPARRAAGIEPAVALRGE
jgi:putative ABC transport system permease protein